MAALVLADDGLHTFASTRDVLSHVEAIDVALGEYRAAWLHDGTVVRLQTPQGPDGPMTAERTGDSDVPGLLAAVRAAGGPDQVDAVLGWVDEELRRQWEHRWPRRPDWLSRRLHGAAPPRATLDRARRDGGVPRDGRGGRQATRRWRSREPVDDRPTVRPCARTEPPAPPTAPPPGCSSSR